MSPNTDLTDVVGTPETALDDRLAATLRAADVDAPAPWTCRLDAVVWWRRLRESTAADVDDVRGPLPAGGTVFAVGAVVRYHQTPVGAYDEVLGGVVRFGRLSAPRAHVPFMAVDSAESLVAGRLNWLLPKTLARFEGGPAGRDVCTARSSGWGLSVAAKAGGPVVPAAGAAVLEQGARSGTVARTPVVGAGLTRPARVTVRLDGAPSFAGWFPAGRCWGVVVRAGTLRMAAATRS